MKQTPYTVDVTKEYYAISGGLAIAVIALVVIFAIVSPFAALIINASNRQIQNSTLPLSDIYYDYYSNDGILTEKSFVSKTELNTFLGEIKETLVNPGDFSVNQHFPNDLYELNNITVGDIKECTFKTYEDKNLIQLQYSGVGNFFTDSTRTSTKDIDIDIYYIGFNLQRYSNDGLDVVSYHTFYSDTGYADRYKEFENSFKRSPYLDGEIVLSSNKYDRYKTVKGFGESDFSFSGNGYIEEIINKFSDTASTVNELMIGFATQKCRQFNFGNSILRILNLITPEREKALSFAGNNIYAGAGAIETEGGTIKFNNNISICKLTGQYSTVLITIDAKIEGGKMYGKTFIFSNHTNGQEKLSAITNSVEDYVAKNLTLVSSSKTSK